MSRMGGNDLTVVASELREAHGEPGDLKARDADDMPVGVGSTWAIDERYDLAYSDDLQVCSAAPHLRIDDISPQELGFEGERMAADYLEGRGWVITERNWTCPFGEADIIAYDDEDCVFVEVKTRLVNSEREQVYPELAVNEAKRRRYTKMAQYYQALNGEQSIRFDVVAIVVVAHRMARLHHLVNAYGSEL